jgi:hypothetical protein
VQALSGTWTRSRRGRLTLAAIPAAALLAWVPSFVAEIYDGDGAAGTPQTGYLARPDRGWEFLVDAVRLSRGTRLGTATDARNVARAVWPGRRPGRREPPVLAESVRLIYGKDPFRVAIPAGGASPRPAKAVARPRTELSWLVEGRVGGGPPQPIGLLDYADGRVVWDIRPVAEGGR